MRTELYGKEKTDRRCAAETLKQTALLQSFLEECLTLNEALQARDVVNAALTDGTASHKMWVKKPQRGSTMSDEDYLALLVE